MNKPRLALGLSLLAMGSFVSAGSAAPDERPVLTVTDTRPFEVRGVGFEPSEAVQVLLTVSGNQRWQRTVASAAGVFVVRFPVSFGACSRFTMQAFGSKGSRARILPRRAQIDCVAPSSDGSQR